MNTAPWFGLRVAALVGLTFLSGCSDDGGDSDGEADDDTALSDDDADDDDAADDDAADDDGPGPAESSCTIRLSGAETAEVTGCLVTLSYFPDGGSLVGGRTSSMLTVVANLTNGATLPDDLSVVSLAFEFDGPPSETTFTLDDAPEDSQTMGGVRRSDASAAYTGVQSLTFTIAELESLGELTAGERIENFSVSGSVTAEIASPTDSTEVVTFESEF